MKKENCLTRKKDFKRLKERGERVVHPLAVLLFCENDLSITRAAVVASKAVGGAVVRNLIKRRLKACISKHWENIDAGWDLIFYSRSAIQFADFNKLCIAVKHLLKRANVWMN